MMAKQCDRCGKLYNSYRHKPRYEVRDTMPDDHMCRTRKVDLCPDCEEKFNKWMGEKEKERERREYGK